MKSLKSILEEKGIKPTYQRLKVFEYMNRNTVNHPTVEMIYERLLKDIPTISMTTVYNTLSAFLEKGLVEILLENIDRNKDIIMPETSAGMEPLCAIYSKRCLNTAENHIKQNKFKIQRALSNHRLKKIPETVLRAKDPELTSFFNINSPEDLVKAEAMAAMRIGDIGHSRQAKVKRIVSTLPLKCVIYQNII